MNDFSLSLSFLFIYLFVYSEQRGRRGKRGEAITEEKKGWENEIRKKCKEWEWRGEEGIRDKEKNRVGMEMAKRRGRKWENVRRRREAEKERVINKEAKEEKREN